MFLEISTQPISIDNSSLLCIHYVWQEFKALGKPFFTMPGIYILDIHEQDMITVFRFQRNRKENKGLDRNLIICHVICDISSFILHENNVYDWCYYSQFPGKPGGTRWLREFPQFSESRPRSANQQSVTWVLDIGSLRSINIAAFLKTFT